MRRLFIWAISIIISGTGILNAGSLLQSVTGTQTDIGQQPVTTSICQNSQYQNQNTGETVEALTDIALWLYPNTNLYQIPTFFNTGELAEVVSPSFCDGNGDVWIRIRYIPPGTSIEYLAWIRQFVASQGLIQTQVRYDIGIIVRNYPVTIGFAQGASLFITNNILIRDAPILEANTIGRIYPGGVTNIFARTPSGYWYQVSQNPDGWACALWLFTTGEAINVPIRYDVADTTCEPHQAVG